MDKQQLFRFVAQAWEDDIVPQLVEYIRIPNKSPMFDAKWAEHGYMDKAVALMEAWAKSQPIKDMRVEEYKTIYDAAMARGGIYPRNLCMEEPPLVEADQLEMVKHQINKMVDWGIFTPPADWTPYVVKAEVAERVRRAGSL